MRGLTLTGVLLVALGLILLAGPVFTYTKHEKVVDVGPVEITAANRKHVDLPPVLLSADVLAVAPQLDGVVLVVTEERTRREDIQRVFELLRSTPVVGTVLNASAEAEAVVE